MMILGAVMFHCDAGRGRAQSRAVNTITRSVVRTITRVTVTPHTIQEPAATHVAIEMSEVSWNFDGRAPLARTADGCSEWRAQRPGESVWYRVRVCGAEVVETIRRIP